MRTPSKPPSRPSSAKSSGHGHGGKGHGASSHGKPGERGHSAKPNPRHPHAKDGASNPGAKGTSAGFSAPRGSAPAAGRIGRDADPYAKPAPYGAKSQRPQAGGTPASPRSQAASPRIPQAREPQPGGTLQARPPRAQTPHQAPAHSPRPQNPAGTIWIYGIHPVAAALANPSRRLRRLLVTEEAEASLAEALNAPFSVQPERTERARLDHLLGHDAVHQGAALLADPLPQPALANMLERPGPILVLDQVTDPRNIGAILRSAAAFGVACVITQDRNAPEETGALAKAASGALETVPLLRAVNLARTLVALKAAGLWVVGLAADAAPLRGNAMAERRIALVLGAEGPGMRRLTRETCDELAGLAMPGTMESLNVSAAATVALYELTRAG